MKKYDKQFIGGEWREGSGERVMENINPYNGEVIYSYKAANTKDIDEAYEAAKVAQVEWSKTLPVAKQELMEKLVAVITEMKDEFFATTCEEGGGTLPRSNYEYHTCIKIVKECMTFPLMMDGKIMPSNFPGKENYIYKKPRGVIGVIAPWNVPYVLAMRSIMPAIATGNAVVVKPSAETPASAFVLAKCFEKAGFPKGLVNVVIGASSEIGDYFVGHPIPDLISFTGSTEIGRNVGKIATGQLKEVSLELGGNNVMILCDDADIKSAVGAAVFAAFFNSGQVCMSLNRVICLPAVYDKFIESFVEAVKHLPVGDPANPDSFMGPLMNDQQAEKFDKFVADTLAAGATVALEGKSEGNMVYPWILSDVTNDMPTACNESFGPICNIMKANDIEEALAIANDTEYGLSGCVFTEDLYKGMKIASRLEVGMAHVNDQCINDEPHVMFGGEKQSGVGRFNAQWVVDKFTTEQWVSVQTEKRF